MSDVIPIYDNHIHMNPDGRNIDALKEFQAAGGTGLTLVTLPCINISKGEDFSRSYGITYSLARRARDCTDLDINVAVGPHPAIILPLSEIYGLKIAEEIMMDGMYIAAQDVLDQKACAIGEVGRPHFEVKEDILNQSNRILLRGMELAADIDCPIIIHCESCLDTYRSLALMADNAGLDRNKVIKHSSLPLVTDNETYKIMPSIPASRANIKQIISKNSDRFMLETDYIDDPIKHGAVMSINTVPKRIKAQILGGLISEESVYRICRDIPNSLYKRD